MDIESIQTKFKSFHEILNPPLVRFLKRIYQGRNGEDIINLKSLDINKFKRRLLEKVKKHKDFVWSENGTRGGVAFDECLKILEDSWYKIANDRNLEEWDRKEREGYISQTQTLRNKYCHPIEGRNPSEEDLLLCAETFYKFGTSIDMSHAELEEIYSIKKILAKEVYSLAELNADMESKTKAGGNPIDIVKSGRKRAKDNFRFQGKGYSIEIKTLFHDPTNTKVLSVNAQVTLELIQDYKIHSCPNKGEHYDYKPT